MRIPSALRALGTPGLPTEDFFLVKSGALFQQPNSPAPGTAEVWGRTSHFYQVRGIDGTDVYKFQSTLFLNPVSTDWVDVAGHTAINANTYATFTGNFRYLRVVKVSGTGAGASIVFGSIAP